MLLGLQSIIDGIMWWAEGCPCHSERQCAAQHHQLPAGLGVSSWVRRGREARIFTRELGPRAAARTSWPHCPMNGKRAPELAAGALDAVLEELRWQSEAAILEVAGHTGAEPEDVQRVMQDWGAGRTLIQATLQIKMRFWTLIPWRLAALLAPDVAAARAAAAQALAQYDQDPEEARHHRVSNEVLGHSSAFRADVVRCAVGEAMPVALAGRLSVMRFMPIVERTIEQKHALVSLALGRRRRSPTAVSLANRLVEFEARLKEDPALLNSVAKALDSVRSSRQVIQQCGFSAHPDAVQLMACGHGAKHKLHKLATALFYHAHESQTYQAHPENRQRQHLQKRSLDRQRLRAAKRRRQAAGDPGPPPDVVREFFLHTAAQHLLAECSSEGSRAFVSLPGDGSGPAGCGAYLRPLRDQLDPLALDTSAITARAGTITPRDGEEIVEDDGGAVWPQSPPGSPPHNSATEQPHNPLGPSGPLAAPAAGAGADPDNPLVFFRFVAGPLTQLKQVAVPPALDFDSKPTDLVVSVHRCVHVGEDARPCVQAAPRHMGRDSDMVSVLRGLCGDIGSLRAACQAWSVQEQRFYLPLPGVRTQAAIVAVSALAVAGAILPGGVPLLVQHQSPGANHMLDGLRDLAAANLAECASEADAFSQWALPSAAARQLVGYVALGAPRPILQVDPAILDIMGSSCYQVASALQADGWEFAEQPPKRGRPPLGTSPADRKLAYIPRRGRAPSLEYFQRFGLARKLGQGRHRNH